MSDVLLVDDRRAMRRRGTRILGTKIMSAQERMPELLEPITPDRFTKMAEEMTDEEIKTVATFTDLVRAVRNKTEFVFLSISGELTRSDVISATRGIAARSALVKALNETGKTLSKLKEKAFALSTNNIDETIFTQVAPQRGIEIQKTEPVLNKATGKIEVKKRTNASAVRQWTRKEPKETLILDASKTTLMEDIELAKLMVERSDVSVLASAPNLGSPLPAGLVPFMLWMGVLLFAVTTLALIGTQSVKSVTSSLRDTSKAALADTGFIDAIAKLTPEAQARALGAIQEGSSIIGEIEELAMTIIVGLGILIGVGTIAAIAYSLGT